MLRLLSIHLKNFLSHADSKLDLANRGLVLIRGVNLDAGGSNGSGKSTCGSAITWCLYGQTYQGLKADEVIRTDQSSCSVTVEGEKDDVPFTITRERGPAALWFTSGDNDLTGSSIKDTQDRIDQFLGLDYKSFIATVLFPQNAQGLASLPQAEQREVLGRILDLDRFEEAFARVKSYRDALKGDLDMKGSELLSVKASLASETKHLEQLEVSQKQFEAEKERKVHALRGQLASLGDKPLPNSKAQRELKELEATDPLFAHQRLMAGQAIQDRNAASNAHKIAAGKARYQALLEALTEPQDQSETLCRNCGQALPEVTKAGLLAQLGEEWDNYNSHKTLYIRELHALGEQELQLKVEQAFNTKTLVDQIKAAESAVRRVDELRKELAAGKEYQLKWGALSDKVAVEETRPWHGIDMLRTTKETLSLLTQQIPDLEKHVAELKAEIGYADFWHDGFGSAGLRHYYLASITPYLSDRANHYLSELTSGTGSLSVATQKENKKGTLKDELTISADMGSGTNFAAKSGGEAQRINIALLFALAELMSTRARVACSILFLDEILDGLDQPGVEQVVKLLNSELVGRKESIFVISHNADLTSEFENVITIQKQNGVSKIL